ncbi:hypothetical protein AMTRI_Chr09g14390 [Amborella trichopoda]|uniref:VPS37 C-terminal domain-containing protein n=1 Tax=Amborella trichopoda TaxID=13333 RepID=W1NK21_AMBTC|nr:vacuolar protein-sorting-associated protein 37 homolog 2 [Amborella trichopoda]ERM96147.1 hypothetical protein AMTR_s00001p00043670 [Amborella trichopoda]|eukprot:XP_006828731.1 vacuolar protein-sorting-associated protein 37 homolog 2 [Amborella trichopoda]
MHRPIMNEHDQGQALPAPLYYHHPQFGASSINSTNSSSLPATGPLIDTALSTRISNSLSLNHLSRPSSPAPTAQVSSALTALQGKSLDEIHQLLTDKKAYVAFLHSLEPVRPLDLLREELIKGHVNLASSNLEKHSQFAELRNQCTIIRSELAGAKERFDELEQLEKEITSVYSFTALLNKLQEAAMKVEDDSESLNQRLVSKDIDLGEFIQLYKKERMLYQRRTLIYVAAKSSVG